MITAVITGASSGMGREFALTLDRKMKFDEIWLIARREERLTELAQSMTTPVRILSYDLTKQESLDEYSALLEEERPDIKLLVNAAGFGKFGAVDTQRTRDLRDMIDLNITATVMMCALSLPMMSRGARIVNLASVSGFTPLPYMNVYSASKAFVLNFSRALENELSGREIGVTAVCPYWVDTEFISVASDTPSPEAVSFFPFMCESPSVVGKAVDDCCAGRGLSLYGGVANAIRVLSLLLPASAKMCVWNMLRQSPTRCACPE